MYTSLNQTDIVALHTSFERQLLLRETCALPPIAENLSKCQPCVQTVHPPRRGALSVHRTIQSSQYTVNFRVSMALLLQLGRPKGCLQDNRVADRAGVRHRRGTGEGQIEGFGGGRCCASCSRLCSTSVPVLQGRHYAARILTRRCSLWSLDIQRADGGLGIQGHDHGGCQHQVQAAAGIPRMHGCKGLRPSASAVIDWQKRRVVLPCYNSSSDQWVRCRDGA